jgi:glycosyltransferase involved in cell wall biosynthesis
MDRPFPNTVVCQIGARRHYAVPVALQQAGLLERLYTDLYAGRGGVAEFIKRSGLATLFPAAKRWSGRAESSLPEEKVHTFSRFGWSYKLRAALARRRGTLTGVWIWGGKRFGQLVCRAGFGSAHAVYAYTSAALEIFEAAKSRGLKCILDHATAPRRHEMNLVQSQYRRYPDWSDAVQEDPDIDAYTARQHQEAQLADVILCGSNFVRNLIDEAWGLGWKCRVVPLGLQLPAAQSGPRSTHDGPLRILFVGDEAMRKGIADLHTAVQIAGRERFEVRAAGRIDLNQHGRTLAATSMELLGSVPRAEMANQYRWADLLVLPSVSDTFGLVIPEAMAHGVPVVTTTNVGAADIIRPGIDGLIVSPNQPEQLADCLRQLTDDRESVVRMSENARQQVQTCTLTEYSSRLVDAIRSPCPQSAAIDAATDSSPANLERAAC